MITAQLSKKTVTFSEIRRLVFAFMKVGYWTLTSARRIKSTQYIGFYNPVPLHITFKYMPLHFTIIKKDFKQIN